MTAGFWGAGGDFFQAGTRDRETTRRGRGLNPLPVEVCGYFGAGEVLDRLPVGVESYFPEFCKYIVLQVREVHEKALDSPLPVGV